MASGQRAFGSLTLVGVFFWVRLLADSYLAALTAALLTLLNDFVYIFSRTALLDFFIALLVWGNRTSQVLELHMDQEERRIIRMLVVFLRRSRLASSASRGIHELNCHPLVRRGPWRHW